MKLKLTEEEIKVFTDTSDKLNQIQSEFGMLQVNQINLETQLESINERRETLTALYQAVLSQQKQHSQSLVEKYGQGNLDTETWEFESTEEEKINK